MRTPLKIYREDQGISARSVALDLGLDPANYRGIENGERNASPATAMKIAEYFDNQVTRDQILFPHLYPQPTRKPVRRAQLQEA